MKLRRLFLAIIASTSLVGCKNKEPNKEPTEDLTPDFQINAEIADTMESLEDKSVYNIKLNYTDKYFKYTASTFKKDLMLLSYGCTMSAISKAKGSKFYNDIGFNVLYTAEEYDTGSTPDSVQYIIAKKNIDDFTVFSIAFKGNRYGLEWSNNFNLGTSGDHEGFMKSATKVYEKLLSYIGETTNYKIWLSGYSRAGAITNVLSHLCMTSTTLNVTEDTLYAYTFAGTRGLTKEHAKPYRNIFNLYNSADLLSNFAPLEYGLYRCGTDIDIFDEKIDELLLSFSSEAILPKFTPSKDSYSNDKEYTRFVLDQLLKEDTETYDPEIYQYDLCSREHFHQIEGHISYFMSLVFAIGDYFMALSETFGNLSRNEMIAMIMDDGTTLHDKFKEMFDKYGVSYDNEKLAESSSVVVYLLKRYLPLALSFTANANASRMLAMHMTETVYTLIKK